MSRTVVTPADIARGFMKAHAAPNTDSRTGKPTAEWVEVTPNLAAEWLDTNERNRPVREREISRYGGDMAADSWVQTGDTVKFSVTGRLLDGQHRLEAIVSSGRTVELLVVTGLSDDSQKAMDQGVRRTAGDSLALDGYAGSDLLASVCRLGHLIEGGGIYQRTPSVSTALVRAFLDEHPELIDVVAEVNGNGKKFRGGRLITPTIAAYSLWRFTQLDNERGRMFMYQFSTGADLEEGNPILALRSRLQNAVFNKERVTQRAAVALMFRAWNAWREDRSLYRMPIALRGDEAPNIPDLV